MYTNVYNKLYHIINRITEYILFKKNDNYKI